MNATISEVYPEDFEAGKLAYISGREIESCPYGHDGKTARSYRPGKRQAWMAGWLEASYFAKYWRRKGESSE